MMRYSADIRSILTVLFAFAISVVPFVVPMPVWALVPTLLLIWYVRSYTPYIQHNHGHLNVFRSKALNTVYDLFLTQLTGYPTALWELHHNRGHHRNYLDPSRDVAAIVSSDGKLMSRWWYALRGNLTIHRDSVAIGRAEARAGQRSLLGKLAWEVASQAAIMAAFVWWNPLIALFCCVLPSMFCAYFIWWESYAHHLGVPASSHLDGSITIVEPRFNWQAFNIGHHTAHHEKPTLHWSLLPARTDVIRGRVPEMCLHDRYQGSAAAQLATTQRLARGERVRADEPMGLSGVEPPAHQLFELG